MCNFSYLEDNKYVQHLCVHRRVYIQNQEKLGVATAAEICDSSSLAIIIRIIKDDILLPSRFHAHMHFTYELLKHDA